MSPIGITLLMAAAFAGFGYLAWRKLAIVARLRPEVRWDHPLARIRRVVVDGLLQSRMIRGEPKAGIMHCVIFTGFLVLLARKIQLIVVGYRRASSTRGGWAGCSRAKDFVELAVLAAVAYAFHRRFVQKPERLEANREAILILSLIAAIMVTDLAVRRIPLCVVRRERPGHRSRARLRRGRSALASMFAGLSRKGRCAPAGNCRTGCRC